MRIARRRQDKRKEVGANRQTSTYKREAGNNPGSQAGMDDERSEKELVLLACEGNREAYWRLVEPHLRAVFSTAQAVLMNSADAEEVAQESLLKALRKICPFRSEQSSAHGWCILLSMNRDRGFKSIANICIAHWMK